MLKQGTPDAVAVSVCLLGADIGMLCGSNGSSVGVDHLVAALSQSAVEVGAAHRIA